ncbi:hypothetical protein AAFF_G00346240 [Aldrovandia affinis]|uniref:Uncharacterized protein n=1 Tax=Aldrovandia affinis TaxID=143900 RepID=A0AAD7SJH3_9TELE|nr:hypothetical protein AAFF_G00346240 [Aldrovandia affinis]
MQALAALWVFVWAHLFPTWGDMVGSFRTSRNCTSFNQGKVPEWGAATPGAAHLCQRFHNSYHFTTLYDTHHRVAVYSAYRFQTSNGGGREKRWFVEPQAYILVGALPSASNWIVKNVNIPEYLWNAYCCLDNNGTSCAGATALNTEQNWVGRYTIADLMAFLRQYANSPVGELFFNNSEA